MSSFLLVFLWFYRYFRQFFWFQLSVKFPEELFCTTHSINCFYNCRFYSYFYCISWSYRAFNYPEYRFWYALEEISRILLTASMIFQIALIRDGGIPPITGDGKFCWEWFFYWVVGTWGGEIFIMQTFFKAKNNILWILNID